jgi:predicted SAM-dependent methyltransferase
VNLGTARMEVPRAVRPLLTSALTSATLPLRSAHLHRELTRTSTALKINVGAGRTNLAGWINTDVTFRSRNHLDLTKPWPMPPGSVDLIYADNVIEHFSLPLARDVLRHARAALRPGGVIRLVTPDVERTARAYLDDAALAQRHLERHRRAGYTVSHPVDLLRVVFAESGHHAGYLYDEQSLTAELAAAGYGLVRRCESGESDLADLRGLESRADETSRWLSLIVEACHE